MFQGLRTVIYPVDDLARAKAWYSEVLGQAPYFDEPFYVGFSVGGYELGLDPNTAGQADAGRVAVAYWGVDDIEATHQRLLALGAHERSPITDVGDGIRLASVSDPFGNVFGIIANPHFKATA
ncbi:MAG TPA: VOC family protein [Ktedonobacterales bacterium]|nr:VOC family protein [Ktedonobacterales bacterium]